MNNIQTHSYANVIGYELQQSLLEYPISLPGWSIDRVIHQSDDAVLYRARHKNNKYAVIKRFNYEVSNMDDDDVYEFIDSVGAVKAIKNKGLVNIYNAGLSHERFYILMEYFQYDNLLNRINTSDRKIMIPQRTQWFKSIIKTVAALHSEGLLHRDLKLSNMMFRDDELVLIDYGIESDWMIKTGLIDEGGIYCTPSYVSPERAISGECNVKTEIYSLGIILYELLTNKKPYTASDPINLVKQHVFAPIPTLPDRLQSYQNLLNKLLAKHPDDRFSSANEVLSELARLD
ncbi:MAG: serine/threonine protein kinase [Thiotrichaceae bacterium]|nr:serine/threonine protein kinase [Thiotrichaceae bacterium]